MDAENTTKLAFHRNAEGLDPTDEAYAHWLDRGDPLRELRQEFWLPQKDRLKKSTKWPLDREDNPCIYLCGSGIGLQPRCSAQFLQYYMERWATQGVFAGTAAIADSMALPWGQVEGEVARSMAKIVGAKPSETILMAGLTISLHLLMASFYRPQGERTKIIVENEAFSSDFFAVESQLAWHGLDVADNMVRIESDPLIPTSRILKALDEHGSSTAMLLLSGVQYLTGQLLDIPVITKYAQGKGVLVCWDLAHAAGNVELKLHEWEVDIAVWCTYKYLNSGPGTVGAVFVHEKHGGVDEAAGPHGYRPRLTGWWGGHPAERFKMENTFKPASGAAGFQVSNVSVLDLTAVLGSMSVFDKTTMSAIRQKSIRLTGYLEHLLRTNFLRGCAEDTSTGSSEPFNIITPASPSERGAQLSLKVRADLLDPISRELDGASIIVDVRKPDIMRVTPMPLYNTYADVWYFISVLARVLKV